MSRLGYSFVLDIIGPTVHCGICVFYYETMKLRRRRGIDLEFGVGPGARQFGNFITLLSVLEFFVAEII